MGIVPEQINLLAQNKTVNRSGGDWFRLEDELRNDLTGKPDANPPIPPKTVKVQIVPVYQKNSDSGRPVKYKVKVWKNGEEEKNRE